MLRSMKTKAILVAALLAATAIRFDLFPEAIPGRLAAADDTSLPPLIRSARSGPWSASATWEGGKVPTAGARVQVCAGHVVVYDVNSDKPIRSVHVAGTLTMAHDRDTRL